MFRKTILLRRKRRLRVVVIILLVLGGLALSPLLLGVALMRIEEILTGINIGENNSALGVLPWFTIVTIAFFGPAFAVVFNLTMLAMLYDVLVLAFASGNRADH